MNDKILNEIFTIIQSVTKVSRVEILSGSRIREIYFSRIIAAYWLRRYRLTFKQIAPLVGSNDPTTVMYQIKAYNNEISPFFKELAAKVAAKIATSEVLEFDKRFDINKC